MKDNELIDSIIKALDAGGLTSEDLRTAPLAQVINLRNLLHHWHQLSDAEVQKRVEATRPKK
jgi:uncharacterized protein YutE (UPF0331/DUF86 family)